MDTTRRPKPDCDFLYHYNRIECAARYRTLWRIVPRPDTELCRRRNTVPLLSPKPKTELRFTPPPLCKVLMSPTGRRSINPSILGGSEKTGKVPGTCSIKQQWYIMLPVEPRSPPHTTDMIVGFFSLNVDGLIHNLNVFKSYADASFFTRLLMADTWGSVEPYNPRVIEHPLSIRGSPSNVL